MTELRHFRGKREIFREMFTCFLFSVQGLTALREYHQNKMFDHKQTKMKRVHTFAFFKMNLAHQLIYRDTFGMIHIWLISFFLIK